MDDGLTQVAAACHDDLRRLVLRPAGMFSNVNEVVEQLRHAERDGYRFVIDWSRSLYRDRDRTDDPWNYYFVPCFDLTLDDAAGADLPPLPGGRPVVCTVDNIITPRLRDEECDPLLLPQDRVEASRLIRTFLRLQADVAARIDAFAAVHFSTDVIGLHIRGPGRVDGGVRSMRRAMEGDGKVAYAPFFKAVDQVLDRNAGARIFACSDSLAVMRAITDRYGMRVLSWPALRSEFGQMHALHPKNAGQDFSGYRLGLDVIAEAWLLARTSWLVHGNSNVTNFVLCLQPDLPHDYIAA